jgi:hypothetical protein
MRRLAIWKACAAIGVAAGLLAPACGCSSHKHAVKPQTITVGDLTAVITPEINPPPVGDNTLDLTLTDSTGAPVPIANISATAITPLTGNTGETQSGRSTGNGNYRIPIRTPISDMYFVTITIERTGKSDVVMKYGIEPQ